MAQRGLKFSFHKLSSLIKVDNYIKLAEKKQTFSSNIFGGIEIYKLHFIFKGYISLVFFTAPFL